MDTVSTQPILCNSACYDLLYCCVLRDYKFPVTVHWEGQTEREDLKSAPWLIFPNDAAFVEHILMCFALFHENY